MLLAELNVRHTRRHMPTRRVALGDHYLPTSGPAYGAILLGAVVSEFIGELDEEQCELVPRLLSDARDGLSVPRIALRYRLQTDTHGLDRSRHRILAEATTADRPQVVLELDRHGRADPQVIGAVLAAAALPPSGRSIALRAVTDSLRAPSLPGGMTVRRLLEGAPDLRAAFTPGAPFSARALDDLWAGIPSDRRWAMEVLGLQAEMSVERGDVQMRFRRLARLAHPDHGAASDTAAERLAELRDARQLLLAFVEAGRAERTG
ncbi:MAG: J domain-containing protein [Acidimicrobiia bacterium]